MSSTTIIEDEIRQRVHGLSLDKQQAVLNFVRGLDEHPFPKGISGPELIALAHEINFDPEQLEQMAQAIEEWCEYIDEPREINFDE